MPNKMLYKPLERNYQLQAQKRHEEFLKQDYYRQTARYFQRETAAAKQFDSWINRSYESCREMFEKKHRAEKLQLRRENLKKLFLEEQKLYELELEEQKQRTMQKNEDFSLEILRQKLLEKKAEQSLYNSNLARRLNSYSVIPSDTKKLEQLYSNVGKRHFQNVRRSSQQTLQNTNIQRYDTVNKDSLVRATDNSMSSLDQQQNECTLLNDSETNSIDDKLCQIEHGDDEKDIQINQENLLSENLEDLVITDPSTSNDSAIQSDCNSLKPLNAFKYTRNNNFNNSFSYQNASKELNKNDDKKANVSVQMFRYSQHFQLKQKIADLSIQEKLLIRKRCWVDALRVREMKNDLILLKNKNLFENKDLIIDNETRAFILSVIETRENVKQKRVKMCNSILYSDEAKQLWNQWDIEDDEISKIEMEATKHVQLNELENDWKNLALLDKSCMSQLLEKVMTKSYVQDEHKLAAIIRHENSHKKQYET